jgi:hypothetical protein
MERESAGTPKSPILGGEHTEKVPSSRLNVRFVEPMLLLRTETLPDDASVWRYELKHDGYRSIAFKTGGKIYLRSRNDNDFGVRYPVIAKALAALPNDTVIDGEIVAFDASEFVWGKKKERRIAPTLADAVFKLFEGVRVFCRIHLSSVAVVFGVFNDECQKMPTVVKSTPFVCGHDNSVLSRL